MLIARLWAALRRRPFSVLWTLLLTITWASLLRVPASAAVLAWVLASLFVLEVWLVFEPTILEQLGCRTLAPREQQRILDWTRRFNISVRMFNDPAPWVGGALRTVVISRGAFELLEDRCLYGLLCQAAMLQRGPIQVREVVVWLGNAPLLAAWCASRWLAQLGRLLAFALGSALLLPLLLWPAGLVRGLGRLLGAILVGLVGAVLVSNGQPALGVALWVACALVPGIKALLAWEARHMEAEADRATLAAGWQLLDALEWLVSHDAGPPCGAMRLLVRPGAPPHQRADRLWATIKRNGALTKTIRRS
jgi:hypothetical protein